MHFCETSAVALAAQQQHGVYNIIAVTMFKSERQRLREWTHHYIFEGVDHFLLVDNNNASNSEYDEVSATSPWKKYEDSPFLSSAFLRLRFSKRHVSSTTSSRPASSLSLRIQHLTARGR